MEQSAKPLYTNLFPNSARSIRIGNEVAHYAGDHCVAAIATENGCYELQATALGDHDERLFGRGFLQPVVNKTNPRAPDLRGTLKKPDENGQWVVAAWWKKTRETEEDYLSLTLSEEATPARRAPAKARDDRPAPRPEATPVQQDLLLRNDEPPARRRWVACARSQDLLPKNEEPAALEAAPVATADPVREMLNRFIEQVESASCAEDWAAMAALASEARDVLCVAA